jgi:hypothetical protein
MKSFIVFWCWMLLAYAVFASIILAGFLIAPEASLVVFGIEFIAFIKGMDYIYEKKRNKKQK